MRGIIAPILCVLTLILILLVLVAGSNNHILVDWFFLKVFSKYPPAPLIQYSDFGIYRSTYQLSPSPQNSQIPLISEISQQSPKPTTSAETQVHHLLASQTRSRFLSSPIAPKAPHPQFAPNPHLASTSILLST
jgi:hypothetical protein